MADKDDPWVRCVDCGRKIHHKKIWDTKSSKFRDVSDKDNIHRCKVCERLKIQKEKI